jgi:hypothetical protein
VRLPLLAFASAVVWMATDPSTGAAQRVAVDLAIHQGPVAGRIVVGHPGYFRPVYPHRVYRAPVVVVAPRVVLVHRAYYPVSWYARNGYRPCSLWYEGAGGRWYDGGSGRRGLREVTVYQREGRYYSPDVDRY